MSILQATYSAKTAAVLRDDKISIHLFKEVISQLEYAGAVPDPTSLEERGFGRQASPRLGAAAADIVPLDRPSTSIKLIHKPPSLPPDDRQRSTIDTHVEQLCNNK
jgi:hypothetical protein